MEQGLDLHDENQEAGEEQLAALIHQAGDEARTRKQEAMDRHSKMLLAVIAEAVSKPQDSQPT